MRELIALLISIFLAANCNVFAQTKTESVTTKSQTPADSVPIRYVVIADVTRIQRAVNDNPHNRYLEVLVDDKEFNEKNLVQLFRSLSRRFGDRAGLFVYVVTSLESIRSPEEYDQVEYWGPRDDYRRFKYAIFTRNGNGERFEFGIPGVIDWKEVIINPPPKMWPPTDKW